MSLENFLVISPQFGIDKFRKSYIILMIVCRMKRVINILMDEGLCAIIIICYHSIK